MSIENRYNQAIDILEDSSISDREIIVALAKTSPAALIEVYKRIKADLINLPDPFGNSQLITEVRDLLSEGKPIAAIKHFSDRTGISLMAAKQHISKIKIKRSRT